MEREKIFKQEFCYEISECGRFFEHYSEDGITRFLIMSAKELTTNYTTYWGVVKEGVIEYVIAYGEYKFANVWMLFEGEVPAPKQFHNYAMACDNMRPIVVVSVYCSSEYRAFCIDASDDEQLKESTAPAQPMRSFTCEAKDVCVVNQFDEAMKFLAAAPEYNETEEW